MPRTCALCTLRSLRTCEHEPIGGGSEGYTRGRNQSEEGREDIPGAGTNRRRVGRIYPVYLLICLYLGLVLPHGFCYPSGPTPRALFKIAPFDRQAYHISHWKSVAVIGLGDTVIETKPLPGSQIPFSARTAHLGWALSGSDCASCVWSMPFTLVT
eukprot:1190881-Prorocentrum_minimum.AAC.2